MKMIDENRRATDGQPDAGPRVAPFLFSLVCYGGFLVAFVYLLAFLGNLQLTPLADAWPILHALVPYSIDVGRDMGSLEAALLIDVALIALFGAQHSVMARPGFKRAWTRIVPKAMERSAYVLMSSVVLVLLMWQWRPIPVPVLWQADLTWTASVAWSVMGLGIVVLLWATFLIDHFELFGLKQGWAVLRRRESAPPGFVVPWLYALVRHPLYVGWLLIFWATPWMTLGHALFAGAMSAYILIAIRFEERDLLAAHGSAYAEYRARVPMLVPRPAPRPLPRSPEVPR